MPTVTDEEEKDQKPQGPAAQNSEKAKPEESSGQKPDKSPNGKGQGDDPAEKSDSAEKDPDKKKEEQKPVDPATKRRRIIIGIAVGVVVLVAGIAWWLYSRTYESTDDAQINGHLNAIASRVAGTVKAVYVENDQPVKAGQTLVDLDPSDYEVLVAQARAGYEQAVAQSAAEDPNVPITVTSNRAMVDTDVEQVINAEAAITSAQRDYDSNVAKLRQAEANNRKAQSDLVRYKKLVDQGEISLSDYDQYVASAGADEAAVEASRYAAASSQQIVEEKKTSLHQQQTKHSEDNANLPRQVTIHKATVESRKANVDSAKAQLDTALLNLSYCHIVAPVDGIASQRSAEIGGRVSQGQQLIVVVQIDNVWTTANFKETQLRKMHVGQRVSIDVDSLDESFIGEVEYMPAATGDRSSLFPPENATGNYVKIVQRLPVRIRFNPKQRDLDKLRPGMSVEPKVHLN
ncbi:MAG: HlyD family secretion protein [Candidatus Sulfotelmatobacter sp.]|jgi:membrane fusion protein (multidrug efflux system)